MARNYVFVDVETTGFDPDWEKIIEVAAVAVEDGEIVDSYATLINPGKSIPSFITDLTGIDDEMVADAPTMASAKSRLKRVIKDRIVVGHNVDFDLGFLKSNGLAQGNMRLDTVTLASVLLPMIGRYDLGYLVKVLELPEAEKHRAEADTYHCLHLFEALEAHALTIDMVQLDEIARVGQSVAWTETMFFRDVIAMKAQSAFLSPEGKRKTINLNRLFDVEPPKGTPLVPAEHSYEEDEHAPDEPITYHHNDDTDVYEPEPPENRPLVPLDVSMVSDLLQPGSNFSLQFPDFEPRQEQIAMVQAVGESFNAAEHLLVEAGTGTGKSLAYLLPAAFWATQNDRRVVISTNTINLQDQLVYKDIPVLLDVLPLDFRVAIRKGKSNYLCARLFKQLRHRGPRDRDEMVLYARLVLWLPDSDTGDVSEIALRGPGERMAWRKISGENAPCSTQECSQERCPVHIARRRAELAHIVIVNHALLLADVANQNHILPFYRDLVIDEAHHLESAVTSGLSFSADKKFLSQMLAEIGGKSGVLAQLQKNIGSIAAAVADKVQPGIDAIREEAIVTDTQLETFFDSVTFFTRDHLRGSANFAQSVRLTQAIISKDGWQDVGIAWKNFDVPLSRVIKGLGKLAEMVADIDNSEHDLADADNMRVELVRVARDLNDNREAITRIITEPSGDMITWVEVWKDRVSLHAAPLHVGPLVEEHLFHHLDSVIMTSATLRTAPQGRYTQANFDYVRDRLNAHECAELALGSPFDYKKNTLLYLCTDMPEPKQPGYQRQVEQAIIDIGTTLKGRTLVLFTSNKQLRETADAIKMPLRDAGVQVLAQGRGSSRQKLTEQFKTPGANAVLLGTKSFWEGVDVPGDALYAVVIVKMPFAVPSDPVVGARGETFDNEFMDYMIPEAVLQFRQGFGRLIRRKTDEGVVVVLDKRVLTKRYGELFINALPETTLLRQKVGRLPEIITRWVNRAR